MFTHDLRLFDRIVAHVSKEKSKFAHVSYFTVQINDEEVGVWDGHVALFSRPGVLILRMPSDWPFEATQGID